MLVLGKSEGNTKPELNLTPDKRSGVWEAPQAPNPDKRAAYRAAFRTSPLQGSFTDNTLQSWGSRPSLFHITPSGLWPWVRQAVLLDPLSRGAQPCALRILLCQEPLITRLVSQGSGVRGQDNSRSIRPWNFSTCSGDWGRVKRLTTTNKKTLMKKAVARPGRM